METSCMMPTPAEGLIYPTLAMLEIQERTIGNDQKNPLSQLIGNYYNAQRFRKYRTRRIFVLVFRDLHVIQNFGVEALAEAITNIFSKWKENLRLE